MNEEPMTRIELDQQRCDTPGCGCGGVIFIHPTCHAHRGVDVSYVEGVLSLRCHKCQRLMTRIAVAPSRSSRAVLQ